MVGVVDDVRQKTVSDEAEPAFYSPLTQLPLRRQTIVVATSVSDRRRCSRRSATKCGSFDPQIAVEFEQVRDLVAGTMRRQQLGMTLMLIFGAVAMLLAAVGIYGVVAYAVSQRRGEMATRLALGATPGSVFLLVMRQGGVLALVGTAIGLAVALISGRIVASQIYAIRASDPLMLGAAIALVVGITALATMIPGMARVAAAAVGSAAHGVTRGRRASSSSWDFFNTSAAFAFGTTATPSSSATMMSPGLTRTPAQVTGTLPRDAVVIDGRGGRDAAAEHRELQLADLRRVADRGIDHRAGKAAVLHRRRHQPADAGVIQAVLQHHHVNRAGRRVVDRVEHAL